MINLSILEAWELSSPLAQVKRAPWRGRSMSCRSIIVSENSLIAMDLFVQLVLSFSNLQTLKSPPIIPIPLADPNSCQNSLLSVFEWGPDTPVLYMANWILLVGSQRSKWLRCFLGVSHCISIFCYPKGLEFPPIWYCIAFLALMDTDHCDKHYCPVPTFWNTSCICIFPMY